jgi:ATP-binding protein involved in chromosome partitioning
MEPMPTREQILEALRVVIDPELRQDIVTLGMVRSIQVSDGGVVDVTVSLTTPGCPIRSHFQTSVVTAARGVEGVTHVNVAFDVLSDQEKAACSRSSAARRAARGRAGPGRQHHLRRLRQGRRRASPR